MYSAAPSVKPKHFNIIAMAHRRINDFAGFKMALDSSRNIVALTGAGTSAESGIPVFRGGGLWKKHNPASLASPEIFRKRPALVWEFYQYRRCVAFNAEPNKAHLALVRLEDQCLKSDRTFHIVTQNVDGLHQKAGSKNVIELHGALRQVKCTVCRTVDENLDNPICEALRERGDPNCTEDLPQIDEDDLPMCKRCGKLVRPNVIWFGESLDDTTLNEAKDVVDSCDICLVIGTSSVVYPAAAFADSVAERGGVVAEFNINAEPAKVFFNFHFPGSCGAILPRALGYEDMI